MYEISARTNQQSAHRRSLILSEEPPRRPAYINYFLLVNFALYGRTGFEKESRKNKPYGSDAIHILHGFYTSSIGTFFRSSEFIPNSSRHTSFPGYRGHPFIRKSQETRNYTQRSAALHRSNSCACARSNNRPRLNN